MAGYFMGDCVDLMTDLWRVLCLLAVLAERVLAVRFSFG